jgi:hypothetical protein
MGTSGKLQFIGELNKKMTDKKQTFLKAEKLSIWL